MSDRIIFSFDKMINGYVIAMPDIVTLTVIADWIECFDDDIRSSGRESYSLLIDSNKHHFESIQCLKSLREYLTQIQGQVSRVAFVAPPNFRESEIVSGREAYFDNLEQAYQWLKKR